MSTRNLSIVDYFMLCKTPSDQELRFESVYLVCLSLLAECHNGIWRRATSEASRLLPEYHLEPEGDGKCWIRNRDLLTVYDKF
jgi:hypothetical protein